MPDKMDDLLAGRYGAYAGFRTEAGPAAVEYYGEDPANEIRRLLNVYVRPDSRVLDLGCGAGQTICALAPNVAEAWGIDLAADLLAGASERVQRQGLTNVTLVQGNTAVPEDVAQLPDDYFDIIFTERGPDMTHLLIGKLKRGGYFLQELVGNYNGFHLQEILGRRPYTVYAYGGGDSHLSRAAEINLLPVSVKDYFYEEFYRDLDHLEAYLMQVKAMLSNWRLEPRPFDRERDRPALERYVLYNTTAKGVRLLGHRRVFVWRHAPVHYYPVDNAS